MRKCDLCKKYCKKTKYGSCLIFTKTDTICCINCSEKYRIYLKLKEKNLLKYILKRQIYLKNKK
tara:strand:+ start:104 stop:295 length:192 start_codon:yes stop_codon:yes gene_type:complete